jgi:hypothetical protein
MYNPIFPKCFFEENDYGPNHEIVINFCKFVNSLSENEYSIIQVKCASIRAHHKQFLYRECRSKYGYELWDGIYWRCRGIGAPYAIAELLLMDELFEEGKQLQFVPVFGNVKQCAT